jgi:PAS domain-containing protein
MALVHFLLTAIPGGTPEQGHAIRDTLIFWSVTAPTFAAAVIGFLVHFKKKVGEPFFSFIKSLSVNLKKINTLEENINNLKANSEHLAHELSRVTKEIFPNGGSSLRDEIQFFAAERLLEFQINPSPLFECDRIGNNLRVNKAYCELFSLSDPNEASRFNWTQFIHETDRTSYVAAWKLSCETLSTFHYKATFVDSNGNIIGKMVVKALPMFKQTGDFLKYRGFLDFLPEEEQ